MRTASAKFLFDVDFAAPPGSKETAPAVSAAAHAAAVAEAEARGYEAGLAAAEARARTQAERQSAAAYERIAAGLDRLGGMLAEISGRFEAEAVEVAVAVARKLAPALIAREPLAEISALASECFRELLAAPHVVVRVGEQFSAAARERLEEIVRASGFTGRLVVLGEPDLAPGDARIEWADGGIVRERAAVDAAIGDAVERYISARRSGER